MTGKSAALTGLLLTTGVLLLIVVSVTPTAFASPARQAAASPTPTRPAAASPAPARTPAPGEQTYVVEAGDTFWAIALKFYGSGSKYPLIVQANNLTSESRLRAGMILIIPQLPGDASPTPLASATLAATLFPFPPTATLAPIATPPVATTVIAATLVSTATPASGTPSSSSDNPAPSPLWVAILNVLSVLCLFGSLVCAVLAYDSYQHAQRMIRRKQIGGRIRVSR